jgi:hypothetical protein
MNNAVQEAEIELEMQANSDAARVHVESTTLLQSSPLLHDVHKRKVRVR